VAGSSFSQIVKEHIPILEWLPKYEAKNFRWDLVAGITLASFVLPESMAYATLAGVPTYFGIYCCLAGGLIFALFTTSRQVALGPTSAISLMIGSTVAVLSGGDLQRWAEIAELSALVVAIICFIAFFFKLSSLVNFISDSILLGFKAGAALSIMATQLPKLFGVEGGGANFFSRLKNLFTELPDTNWVVLLFGISALILLIIGEKLFHNKPVSLVIVIVAIIVISFTQLSSYGLHITGEIPKGLPKLGRPSLRFRDVEGVLELAFACFLLAYIETISAARTFATKNNYEINPRQELLSLGFANIAASFSSAYIVSGGLSQSTVNEKSGARTPLAIIICSATLTIILLFLTGLLKNLPEVILAVIVLHAVSGLIKIKELKHIYRLSRPEFLVAMIALVGVLLFGILKGVLVAVVMSIIFLLRRTANPVISVLGRIANTSNYSDISRHTDNIVYDGLLILRIESSLLYFNSESTHQKFLELMDLTAGPLRCIILDLSASPYMDVGGSKIITLFEDQLRRKGIQLKIVNALAGVREILRKQGLEDKIGHINREDSIQDAVQEFQDKFSGQE
jgi:sulfate permease, SulP family